ncbi:MAG: hypothetical protein NZZ41_04620 [Candidatus Dojkabacteria bacterium]|nr:hypothetical protein [Candidatus Dojkabacteria bacterium]
MKKSDIRRGAIFYFLFQGVNNFNFGEEDQSQNFLDVHFFRLIEKKKDKKLLFQRLQRKNLKYIIFEGNGTRGILIHTVPNLVKKPYKTIVEGYYTEIQNTPYVQCFLKFGDTVRKIIPWKKTEIPVTTYSYVFI